MRIGIATTMGGYEHARVLDGVLGRALGVRGAKPEFILCDGAIPACQMTKLSRFSIEDMVEKGQADFCNKCFTKGVTDLGRVGYPVQMLTGFLDAEERALAARIAEQTPFEDIRTFTYEGMAVGEHSNAGALRYFARGDLENEPLAEPILRKYLEAGMLTVLSMRNMIRERGYEIIVANHGIYAPQGHIVEAARSLGVRVVTYNPAYRRHSFVFSHHESYHFSMITEPLGHWESLEWTDKLENELMGYLASRRSGTNDWIWFHHEPDENHKRVLRRLGADPDKPYAAMLTSVIWDAQLHYEANAYDTMMEWVMDSVRLWSERDDDMQLLIRVHPAEVRGAVPSRQKVVQALEEAYGKDLPKNVFVVAPDDEASTYALCDHANAVIVFNTKAGAETAATGSRVIVAGEAWIRGKGISRDASSPEDYALALSDLPYQRSRLTGEALRRAKRYAYHFFFRRMIPLPFIHQDGKAKLSVEIESNADLSPGRWLGLDVICDGILYGHPFTYPAESMAAPFEHEADLSAA